VRVLDYGPLIGILVVLSLLLAICAAAIYVSVRYGRQAAGKALYCAVLLLGAGLFCVLIDFAILALPFERVFKVTGLLLLLLSFIVFSATFLRRVKDGRRGAFRLFSTPDLKSVFDAIDDLAVIFDYRGGIAEANHPEQLAQLFPGARTLWDMLPMLEASAEAEGPEGLDKRLAATTEKLKLETRLRTRAGWYDLSILPVLSGKSRLGHIMILQDISAIKKTEQLLRYQNDYQASANEKLTDYVRLTSTLEAERERLKLMRHIQADLIDQIENAVIEIQKIQKQPYESTAQLRADISKAADLLRHIYRDVRSSIGKISGKKDALHD